MTWPEIFNNPDLIQTRDPRSLCADALCAWANCKAGSQPPESFGRVLVAVAVRIGMKEGATSENISAHAKAMGWID